MKILGFEVGKKKEKVIPLTDGEAVKIISDAVKKNYTKQWLLGRDVGAGTGTPYRDIASVFKAVKAICDNIAQAEPSIFDRKTNEMITESDYAYNFIRLLRKPNPRQSFADFIQEWAGYYSLNGEGFILKVRSVGNATGATKTPAELVVLNPKGITEMVDRNTNLLVGWKYNNTNYGVDEIINTKDFNPYNAYRGLSPLLPIADEMKIDQKSLEFNLKFFQNDATPSLVLSSEKNLTPEQRKRLEEWWLSKHKGSENAFNMEVLENGMKASVISQSHKDMEFLEQKRFTREELLGIWKAPKALFNITDDLNYATFTGQMKIFWIYSLMPIMRKFEDSINAELVNKIDESVYFKFDLSNVPAFQEDYAGKVATAKTLFDMGEPLNEINKKLDLGFEDATWGDDWWVSGMLMPAKDVMAMADEPMEEEPEEKPEEKPEEEQAEEEKSVKFARTTKQLVLTKAFRATQSSLQYKLDSKIKRLFYDIRKQVMSTPTEELAKGNINVDWVKMDKELRGFAMPIIDAGVKAGADIGKRYVGKSIADDILNSKLNSYVAVRGDKIVGINRVTEKKIRDTVKRAIAEGQGTMQTATDILALGESVRSNLKGLFNSLASRARTIAVTETAGAVNGGSFIYYEEVGITHKSWLTSDDELVRHSHEQCESQGSILLTDRFSNGLRFPSDQDGMASEIVNCRCTLEPEVK